MQLKRILIVRYPMLAISGQNTGFRAFLARKISPITLNFMEKESILFRLALK